MSRADVEAVELVYARWGEGRFDAADIFDPQIEIDWSPDAIETAQSTRGLGSLSGALRRWFQDLEDVRFEAERFVDLGDRVLVVTTMRARGRGSGAAVANRYGHLWTLCDGRAVRIEDAAPDAPATRRLETAVRFMELGRRRDWSRLALVSKDLVYRPIAETTEAAEQHGPAAFQGYIDAFYDSGWVRDLDYEVVSVRAHGDAVVVVLHLAGHGRASDLRFRARIFEVLRFDASERIVRIEDFLDADDAVRATAAPG